MPHRMKAQASTCAARLGIRLRARQNTTPVPIVTDASSTIAAMPAIIMLCMP